MGYRQAAVLASVSFFLGVLFLCFSVDYKILFAPLTEDIINDGLAFYTTFYHSPAAIKARPRSPLSPLFSSDTPCEH
ncbi:uncharacterized protein FIBRA_04649 [Fibroporia radiculosa]|uniref:Uncharacterized protein n=1 Tax=Fibroporia radiculosa TaxID=599839 RepID=J4IAA0_9APHY|nr:uncharacterized protein FIBRA_04649 [Fibroporia radiculosa]CCM02546.1 predicted protein [Fibroporia radiculosa]